MVVLCLVCVFFKYVLVVRLPFFVVALFLFVIVLSFFLVFNMSLDGGFVSFVVKRV